MCFHVTVKEYENSQIVKRSTPKYSTEYDLKGNLMEWVHFCYCGRHHVRFDPAISFQSTQQELCG